VVTSGTLGIYPWTFAMEASRGEGSAVAAPEAADLRQITGLAGSRREVIGGDSLIVGELVGVAARRSADALSVGSVQVGNSAAAMSRRQTLGIGAAGDMGTVAIVGGLSRLNGAVSCCPLAATDHQPHERARRAG
jgi:hypothetical protein